MSAPEPTWMVAAREFGTIHRAYWAWVSEHSSTPGYPDKLIARDREYSAGLAAVRERIYGPADECERAS